MQVKKIIGKVHLVLGLSSGLVVFILAITGCLYAFQEEIQDLTQPYRFVQPQEKQFLAPSKLATIADQSNPGRILHAVLYGQRSDAARAIYYMDEQYYDIVYINPYSGTVQKVQDVKNSFFQFVLDGHFYLWLPHAIGQTVVASATLIFLALLVTGIILWWPKNKNGRRQRFTIKWSARWRRKNYDLHNVVGFYVSWLAIIFAITGLVWGFEWFEKGVYRIASGGKAASTFYNPGSDTTQGLSPSVAAVDQVYLKMQQQYPAAKRIEVHIPQHPSEAIEANANPGRSTYWQLDYRYYDQFTLQERPVTHTWGRYSDANSGDMVLRMNYDIHTGAILGLSGKVLAFLASLVIASLPITGFIIWWGRKNKQSKRPAPHKKDLVAQL